MQPYTQPSHKASAFNCPYCGAYARQTWYQGTRFAVKSHPVVDGLDVVLCSHCKKFAIWYEQKLIVPDVGSAPLPNVDLPDDVRADYEEARSVAQKSPRSAAALLRLALQKLCKHLNKPGKNLNDDIGALVSEGLPRGVQKALDVVRVAGNESVHPGVLDLRDDQDTAGKLFSLLNFICNKMISEPKEIDQLYSSLPREKQDAISKRDKNKK